MDITARLTEAKPITALFRKFDDRGLDAYDSVASFLFDSLDASDEQWFNALGGAVIRLGGLNAEAEDHWLDATEGERVSAQIDALWAKYVAQPASAVR